MTDLKKSVSFTDNDRELEVRNKLSVLTVSCVVCSIVDNKVIKLVEVSKAQRTDWQKQ